MKRGPQSGLEKKLSIKNLLKVVRESFDIPEPKREEKRGLVSKISIKDCLMSSFAMFSLKMQSLLAFDNASNNKIIKHNLKSLYKLEAAPSHTYMREKLDPVDPEKLRPAFLNLFEEIQRGKLLAQYVFMNGYLLAVDGTEVFESKNVFCDNCGVREHSNGIKGYYHQILAGSIIKPGLKQVIPLCPEPIVKQDGTTKNDCESNAMRRFLNHVKKEHPRLNFTIVTDALTANTPGVNFRL